MENMLRYFTSIRAQVDEMVNMKSNVMLEMVEIAGTSRQGEIDELLADSLRHTALNIKVRFLLMQKIAQAYSEISQKHILNGFDMIDKYCLGDQLSGESGIGDELSSVLLDDYRKDAMEEIENIANMVSYSSS